MQRNRLTSARFSDTQKAKKANDVYRQNTERKEKDHEAEAYAIRSDFAEGVDNTTPWRGEKRDPDTNMPVASKKAQYRMAKRRAAIAMKIAELILPGADDETVDEQSFELMNLPESVLQSTYDRVSSLRKTAEEMPGSEAMPAAPDAEDTPLAEEGAADMATGADMPPVEGEADDAPTVEEALTQAKDALETVEQVLDEIQFDGGDAADEGMGDDMGAPPAGGDVLASLYSGKVPVQTIEQAKQAMQAKQAAKKGVSALPTTKKASSNVDNILSRLWKSAPKMDDVFNK
jgi:hypothetical protein